MRLEVVLVSEEQDEKRRDGDVARNKRAPVERMLEDSIALDEEQEDVEDKVGAVQPDAAKGLVRKRVDIDVLLCRGRPDPELCERDARPGDVGRRPAHAGHVRKHLARGQSAVHEAEETPEVGCEDRDPGNWKTVSLVLILIIFVCSALLTSA